MTISPVTALVVCTAFGFLAYKFVVHPAFVSPLAKIPNAHPVASISNFWFKRQIARSRELKTLYGAHKTKGEVVRLGLNEVSVASPEGLRQIYTAPLEKDPWYGQFENFSEPNMTSMVENGPHSIRKRAISKVYTKSYIHGSTDVEKLSRAITYERFLPFLKTAATDQQEVNVFDFAQWISMDFTTAYLFGIQNGTNFVQDQKARERYFKNYHSMRDINEEIQNGFEKACMKMCEAASLNDTTSVPNNLVTNPVVFTKLYEHLSEEKSDNVFKKMASEMLDHILAAHETTGITMTYVMYRLSLDKSLQAELRKELLTLNPPITVESKNKLPSPSTIDQLPLLNAVVHETLRRHSSAAGRLPRKTPPGGIVVHGYFIPEGTIVSSNAYTLHRNEDIFPEPEQWLPSRWIGNDEHEIAMRKWFWPFGSGSRMCIGNHFAIQMLKLLIATVYTNYTTEIIDDEGIEQADFFVSGPVGNKLVLKFAAVPL